MLRPSNYRLAIFAFVVLLVTLLMSSAKPANADTQIITYLSTHFIEVHVVYDDGVEMTCTSSTKRQSWSKNHDGFDCLFSYPEPILKPKYDLRV